jgi:hypothetical protein
MSEVQAFGALKALYDKMPAKEISWIAGGALRSYLLGEKVKDLDIFSNNPSAVQDAFTSDASFKAGFQNDLIANFYKDGICYQVIKKYKFETPLETINNFDFTIICCALGKDGIVADERFYIDNAQKRLVVKSLPKPLSTIKRGMKYSKRGYAMCPVGLAKILKAVQENPIDWDNPNENEIEFYPDGTPSFRGLD